MGNRSRILSVLLGFAILGGLPLAPAPAAETTIRASATVVKSLTLTKKQDLDFGTVTLSGAPGTYTVSIGMDGVLSCPVGATCAGTPMPGIMNVQGSNKSTIRIAIESTGLVNDLDGTSIAFTPMAPTSLALSNSGFPGTDFNIGGSIDIPSSADGTYSGNIEVMVEYQ